MKRQPILENKLIRAKLIPHAPWLALPKDQLGTQTSPTEPIFTPLLTASSDEGQLSAWAPEIHSHLGQDPNEEIPFSSSTRAKLCQWAWSAARQHTPMLGVHERWRSKTPPQSNSIYGIVGDSAVLSGKSLGASLLIGYIAWISELAPLKWPAVSISLLTDTYQLGGVDGLEHKLKTLTHLPSIKELLVYPTDLETAQELVGSRLEVREIETIDQLVTELWGTQQEIAERARAQLTHALPQPEQLKRHLMKFERVMSASERRDLALSDRVILNHMCHLQTHPLFNEVFSELSDLKQLQFRFDQAALERHLGLTFKNKHCEVIESLISGQVEPGELGLNELSEGLKQEWFAECLQHRLDKTPDQQRWRGWRAHLDELTTDWLKPSVFSNFIVQHLLEEDDSSGRAKLIGSFARHMISQGEHAEAHKLARRAVIAWQRLAQEDHNKEAEMSYPISTYWRSLRMTLNQEALQEKLRECYAWLQYEPKLSVGWCFITHEVLRAGLWQRAQIRGSALETHDWLREWLLPLSQCLLAQFEQQLFGSGASTEPMLIDEELIGLLMRQVEPLQWPPYMIGSACGAMYEAAESLGEPALKARCERIWSRLLREPEQFEPYFLAQRALSTLRAEHLRECQWERVQGVGMIASCWLEEGYSRERIEHFFADPMSDQELLGSLKLRATYVS